MRSRKAAATRTDTNMSQYVVVSPALSQEMRAFLVANQYAAERVVQAHKCALLQGATDSQAMADTRSAARYQATLAGKFDLK